MNKWRIFLFEQIVCLLFILFTGFVYADEQDSLPAQEKVITGTVSLLSGLKRGTVYEYVFSGDDKVSELAWQLHNLYYVGVNADCLIAEKFYFFANFETGVNRDLGYIEDSDWVDASNNPVDYKTCYSKHSCVLEYATFFDFAAGYRITTASELAFIPMLGLNYTDIKMSAYDGYFYYMYSVPNRGVFCGEVMSYRQKYLVPKTGLKLQDEYRDFKFEAWGFIGFLGYCEDIDNHYLRNLDFYGTMYFVQSYEAGISISYSLFSWLELKVYTSFYIVPLARGSLYSENTISGVKSKKYKDAEGIGMSLWDAGIAAVVRY